MEPRLYVIPVWTVWSRLCWRLRSAMSRVRYSEGPISAVMESRDTCLVSRLSRDVVLHVSVLAQSRHLYVLARVSSFHVSSCLMSHDCVLTVSLSGIAKCFILCWHTGISCSKSGTRPIYLLFTCLPYLKTNVRAVLLFCGYNVSW